MKSPKIGVFRQWNQPRMMNVAETVQVQRKHDAEVDSPDHRCDLCPIHAVFQFDEASQKTMNRPVNRVKPFCS